MIDCICRKCELKREVECCEKCGEELTNLFKVCPNCGTCNDCN